MSQLIEQLGKAIYGGPFLSAVQIKKQWLGHGLDIPCHVLAVHIPRQEDLQRLDALLKNRVSQHKTASSNSAGIWLLNIHSGLAYVSFNGSARLVQRAVARAGFTASPALVCTSFETWIATIQQAIVQLRQLELKQIHAGAGKGGELGAGDQHQACALALEAIRLGESNWPDALDVWIKIVLLRHSQQINEVRRHQVEFLAQLTNSIDHNVGLSYPFYEAVNSIYQTFAFSKIPDAMRRIVSDIRPHLIRPIDATSPALRLVNGAIKYLNDRAVEPFKLEDMSKSLHVSPNHLARVFHRHTGQTIVQYLHALRIGQAKSKLRDTDDTVLAVSLDCGFESVEHFHRIFKRLTGTTPARYRKNDSAGATP